MTKKINLTIILFIIGLILFHIDTYATETNSESFIEYETIELKDNTTQSCNVSISIPYSYSETIPKNPTTDTDIVQTGDDSHIFEYALMMGVSTIGIFGILYSKKEK